MAKKSKIARDKQRRVVVARYRERRLELLAKIKHPDTPPEERDLALVMLQGLPRDASPTRLVNRDRIDGRPRGHLRKFGLARTNFRTLAHQGELPGVIKASW